MGSFAPPAPNVDFGLLRPPALPPDPLIHAGLAQQLRIGQQVAQQSAAESAQKLQEGSLNIAAQQRALKNQQIYSDTIQQMLQEAQQPPAAAPGAPQQGAPPQGTPQASGGAPQVPAGPRGGAPGGIDPNALFFRLAKNGLTGDELQKYQGTMMDMRLKGAEADKNVADAALARTTTVKNQSEDQAGMAHAFLALPPADRPAAFPQFEQQMLAKGYLDPLKAVGNYQAFGGDAGMVQFLNSHQTATEQTTQTAAAQKLAADQAEETRKALKGPAEQAKAENEAKTTLPDPVTGLTPEQTRTADQAKANAEETARHNSAAEKTSRGELGVAQGGLAIKQKELNLKTGGMLDANGNPLSPEQRKAGAVQDPVAVAQANYLAPVPQTRSGMPNPQLEKVYAINPTYDVKSYNARNKIATDFSASGVSGKAITSADTALAHLDAISRAGQALNKSDFKAVNAIANEVGAQVGGSAKNTYDTIVSMVSPEISKAVIGEAGGEGERQAMQKNFASDTAPEVREKAIGAAAGLLGARVHKQAQAYEADMGKPFDRKLSPESQAVLDRYSGAGGAKGDMINVQIPGQKPGQIHRSQREAFKTANPNAVFYQ